MKLWGRELPLSTWVIDLTVRQLFKRRMAERMLLWSYERWGSTRLLKLAPNHYQYPLSTRRVCTRSGVRFDLDIATYHGWSLYYARSSQGDMVHYVDAGDIVFDVGANIGEVAMLMARKVSAQGHVYAFEPQPEIYQQLARNQALNGFDNCTLLNMGVSDRVGMADLVIPDGRNPGTATFAAEEKAEVPAIQNIKVTTIDQYVSDHGISRMDLMKIDTEGMEHAVIRGGSHTISTLRPRLIIEVVDAHQRRHHSSADSLLRTIWDLGYHIYELGTHAPLRLESSYEGCVMDVLCEPISR